MRCATALIGCLLISMIAARSFGHGNPVHVNVANGQLTVAHGLTLTKGYVRLASDPHEDAALDFGPGQTLRSVYPGYDLAGLAADAALNFEVVARLDFGAEGQPTRWLWYWNPSTQTVATAANDPTFNVLPLFGSGGVQIRQSAIVLGPALTMANPVGPYLGADQHLLIYQLQNSPAAEFGVYGVFARLTSPGLESSEPFLLAFRYGVAAEDFAIAAQAINVAAALPGDFNRDNVVDAADFTVWRDGLGSIYEANDYDIWRSHFGLSLDGASNAATDLAAVPEPSGLALSVFAVVGALVKLARKSRAPGRWRRNGNRPFSHRPRLRMIQPTRPL